MCKIKLNDRISAQAFKKKEVAFMSALISILITEKEVLTPQVSNYAHDYNYYNNNYELFINTFSFFAVQVICA